MKGLIISVSVGVILDNSLSLNELTTTSAMFDDVVFLARTAVRVLSRMLGLELCRCKTGFISPGESPFLFLLDMSISIPSSVSVSESLLG